MTEQRINPEKITKPIQLLAAWLIGLIILVGALITGATQVKSPTWLPVFYSISSVAIIPLFLYFIFKLQTKYRTQMQEDHYYAQYLNKDTMTMESLSEDRLIQIINDSFAELAKVQQFEIESLKEKVTLLLPNSKETKENKKESTEFNFFDRSTTAIFVNQKLPNYLEIMDLLLHKLRTGAINLFGDKLENNVPSIFLLSFGKNVSVKVLKVLIAELLKFGLTHLRIIEENVKSECIYIGSYAFGIINDTPHETLRITDENLRNIHTMETTLEIYSYVKRNMSYEKNLSDYPVKK